jgi:uncharacterized membrane protein YvlD (DUF360 family)
MDRSLEFVRSWTRVAIVTGFLAVIVYPLLLTVSMPLALTLVLAGAFGPLLSVACFGLYQFMAVHRKTVSLQVAAMFTIIAGTVVNLMLVAQMSIRAAMTTRMAATTDEQALGFLRLAYSAADKVQLGLDVSWDIYIGLGTILFGLNMLRNPWFGKIVGSAGMLVGVLLLVFNIATFPVPPGEVGSIDFGPFVGLWYLVVTILMVRGYRRLGTGEAGGLAD